ncbi:hypothetical protein [Lentzea sp. CA-135723]|uniref:hypothetical protein n=1 Tax=Lentzea sp. CA-135723 TaxID=3239950 RepID=UPI003D8E875C
MMKTVRITAACVEPDVDRADDLDAPRWHEAAMDTPTRKAAYGADAASAFFLWSPEGDFLFTSEEMGSSPVEFLVKEYRSFMGHAQAGDTLDVVLRDLLADLWHLAAAYGIKLDAIPVVRIQDSMAMDLRLMLLEIRNAAHGVWADTLKGLGVTLEEIEAKAYRTFLSDCSAP